MQNTKKQERDQRRRQDILDAALELLLARGLAGVTTSGLARLAQCSKDTLYNLFADRDEILASLVTREAQSLNEYLEGTLAGGHDAGCDALREIGVHLYELLTSPTSLALNRAALGETSGALSEILLQKGRSSAAPKIMAYLNSMQKAGMLGPGELKQIYHCFYGLLLGDHQILALHKRPARRPSRKTSQAIAQNAVAQLLRLFPAENAE